MRILLVKRGHAQGNIFQYLDEDAPEPQQHRRSKLRITSHADNELVSAAHHFLNRRAL